MNALKISIISILCFSHFIISGQSDVKVWVEFTNKGNSSYALDNPEQFLSKRAINRRNAQNIDLDSTDLPITAAYLNGIKATGAYIIAKSKYLNGVLINADDTSTTFPQVRALPYTKSSKHVSNLQKDTFKHFKVPTNRKTGKYFAYGNSNEQLELSNGVALHELGHTGMNKVIAVLDAGFRGLDTLAHFKRLRDKGCILGWRDFVDKSGTVYDINRSTHGMEVMSVMGAYVEEELIGSAPDAKYWLLRTEDELIERKNEEFHWIEGLEFADSVGADIINSSLSYTVFNKVISDYTVDDLDGKTAYISIAANMGGDKGMVLVNSAGNEGQSAWGKIAFPADAENVLAVGGVFSTEDKVPSSSFGPSADERVKPDVMAQGFAVKTASLGTDRYDYSQGTSLSAPIIAGLIACFWDANPEKTAHEIRTLVRKSADRYESPSVNYGYGIADFMYAHYLASLSNCDSLLAFPIHPVTYPNPTSGKFHIHFFTEFNEKLNIEIFNMGGELIYRQELHSRQDNFYNIPVDILEHAERGIYLLNVYSSEDRNTFKIVKQ